MAQERPEGTDSIIEGAGVGAGDDVEVPAAAGDGVAASAGASATGGARREQPDDGASGNGQADGAKSTAAGDAQAEPQSFTARMEGLRGQANDRVYAFADQAKTRATDGLDDVVRMIDDAAAEVDGKLGQQFGDYVRRASAGVSGVSDALKGKDVDALFAEAGDLVRKAPGVAIGAAAAIGFVLARFARAGLGDQPVGGGPKRAA